MSTSTQGSTTWLLHELRQPLAVIQLLAEAVENGAPNTREKAARISAQLSRIARIMRHAREHTLQPVRAPVTINLLVTEIVDLVAVAAPLPMLLDLGEDVLASLDRGLIEQVLLNLLRNAHEAGGKHIVVRTRCDGHHVEIDVMDDGPGIAASVAGRLFEPHVTTKATGCGVGLAISREIVDSHGGSLTVQRTVDDYTMFRVRLPLTGER